MQRLALAWSLALGAGSVAAQGAPGAPAAEPLGAYRPVPELPGAGRPVDTAAVAARRRAVARAIGRGVALVPAASRRDLEREYLQDNDFRQHNTFYYLTGVETPGAWLLIAAVADSTSTALFLPVPSAARRRWTGLELPPDSAAARLTGIAVVHPLDSLAAAVTRLLRRGGEPVYVPLDGTSDETGLRRLLVADGRPRDVRNLRVVVDSLRMVKDADELARLRRAIAITVDAQGAALGVLRPGLWEYQLEAVIEHAFRWHGADRVGFPSIIASGPNSSTLHYDVNRRLMQAGDLVVIDIGAEWGQYTADVTRTLPVSGRFTPRQRAIYDLVLGAQQAVFEATRPGRTLHELHDVAVRYLRERSGDLCGTRTCDAFFIHGIGHHLGMDVHDVTVRGRQRLEPGMVFTIEPGIYLPDEALGVRIEDDVLVTAGGAEWLSGGAPRAAAEIERLMRRGQGGR